MTLQELAYEIDKIMCMDDVFDPEVYMKDLISRTAAVLMPLMIGTAVGVRTVKQSSGNILKNCPPLTLSQWGG